MTLASIGAREVLADRPLGGVGRVGSAHELAKILDGVVLLEHHDDAGAGAHELREAVEEGPLLVNRVEGLRLSLAHVNHAQTEDRKAGVLDPREDLAGDLLPDSVRLDDGKRSLSSRAVVPF